MMVPVLMLLPVFVLMVHSPSRKGQAPENVSGGGAGGVTTEEQLVCNDGTSPDVTTGLCADGSQPQGQAPQQLVCNDGTSPDVNGLCADGSSAPGARTSSRERK